MSTIYTFSLHHTHTHILPSTSSTPSRPLLSHFSPHISAPPISLTLPHHTPSPHPSPHPLTTPPHHTPSPHSLSLKSSCESKESNGICDQECNTSECPYDFVDCRSQRYVRSTLHTCPVAATNLFPLSLPSPPPSLLPSLPHPSLLHRFHLFSFQADNILVLILVTPVTRPFINPWSDSFLKELGRLTNSVPVVIETTVLTSRDLAEMGYEQNLFPTNFSNHTM